MYTTDVHHLVIVSYRTHVLYHVYLLCVCNMYFMYLIRLPGRQHAQVTLLTYLLRQLVTALTYHDLLCTYMYLLCTYFVSQLPRLYLLCTYFVYQAASMRELPYLLTQLQQLVSYCAYVPCTYYVLTSSAWQSACEGYFTYMYLITWLVTHLVGYNTSHLIEPCTYYVLASPTRQPVCEGYFTYLVPQLVNYLTYLLAWLVSYRTYLLTQLVTYLHVSCTYCTMIHVYLLRLPGSQQAKVTLLTQSRS